MATRTLELDAACAQAVDLALDAVRRRCGVMGVGDHVGVAADDVRVATHFFTCPHPGYRGWRWSVTVARASRARVVTVSEVCLVPGEGALVAPAWVPWAERVQPGDVAPGILMPTPDNDPRVEPGFTGGDQARRLLRTCATTDQHFFDANTTTLVTHFNKIANEIASRRIRIAR